MASIKVKFRQSAVPGHEGAVYYQIIHERKVRQLTTDYHVLPSEWDNSRATVKIPPMSDRVDFLLSLHEKIRFDIERLTRIVHNLDKRGMDYHVNEVIDEYNRHVNDFSLTNFMTGIILRLKQNGKTRTSETYTSTLHSFRKFLSDRTPGTDLSKADIMTDCITPELMEAYEVWLVKRGVTQNTSSFYMRILRATYNRAVENGATENRHPFRHVYTGVGKTLKRALPLQTISRIKELDLSQSPALDYARDMFIMSFMLRGMSFVDMAYLKKTDRRSGYVTYRRRKTGQRLTIEWTMEMQQILDKYKENRSDYLLPIIKYPGCNERYIYRNAGYNINRSLKIIAQLVGVNIPLTLYVARHSWATAARTKGIPLSVISEGMGHDSESTTKIYLASLDGSIVDKANSLILASL